MWRVRVCWEGRECGGGWSRGTVSCWGKVEDGDAVVREDLVGLFVGYFGDLQDGGMGGCGFLGGRFAAIAGVEVESGLRWLDGLCWC